MVLLLALLAGLCLAVAYTPRYRENRVIALLRPLLDERTDILYGSHSRFGSLPLRYTHELSDDRRAEAINRYPALIARIRALHPEIHSDIRDRVARLMELEIGYHQAAQEFEKARDSTRVLAEGSVRRETAMLRSTLSPKTLPLLTQLVPCHSGIKRLPLILSCTQPN